jgi:hypothetical protein
VIITNAEQYSDTNFACLIDNEFKVYPLTATYQGDKKTVTITQVKDQDPILIDSFRQIMYGNDQKDVNLCMPTAYEYVIDGAVPDLTKNSGSVHLKHAILPGVTVTMNIHG